jgi:hypothetical protein
MACTSDADARADLEADLDRLIALKCPEVTDPAPYKAEVLRAFDEANRRFIAIHFRMYVDLREMMLEHYYDDRLGPAENSKPSHARLTKHEEQASARLMKAFRAAAARESSRDIIQIAIGRLMWLYSDDEQKELLSKARRDAAGITDKGTQ